MLQFWLEVSFVLVCFVAPSLLGCCQGILGYMGSMHYGGAVALVYGQRHTWCDMGQPDPQHSHLCVFLWLRVAWVLCQVFSLSCL